jgi:outer membrane protein assembly factor BamB
MAVSQAPGETDFTFACGSAWDAAGEAEVAKDGFLYVLGSTKSSDFPTTDDAVQRRFGGGPDRDVFLLRLDPKNGKIVYSTLLGGSKNDEATGLAIADDGTAYIGGVTMSADFPGMHANRFSPGAQQDAPPVIRSFQESRARKISSQRGKHSKVAGEALSMHS